MCTAAVNIRNPLFPLQTRSSFSILSSSLSRGAQATRLASSSLGLRHANSRVALGAADRVVDGLRRAQSQHERRCTQLQREVVQLSQNIRKNNERLARAKALLNRPLSDDFDESRTPTLNNTNNIDAFESRQREIRAETAANERTRSRLEAQRTAIRAQDEFAERKVEARVPEVRALEA